MPYFYYDNDTGCFKIDINDSIEFIIPKKKLVEYFRSKLVNPDREFRYYIYRSSGRFVHYSIEDFILDIIIFDYIKIDVSSHIKVLLTSSEFLEKISYDDMHVGAQTAYQYLHTRIYDIIYEIMREYVKNQVMRPVKCWMLDANGNTIEYVLPSKKEIDSMKAELQIIKEENLKLTAKIVELEARPPEVGGFDFNFAKLSFEDKMEK